MSKQIDELERLSRLRENGTLSEEEFEREKARLLTPGTMRFQRAPRWIVAIGTIIGLALAIFVLKPMLATQSSAVSNTTSSTPVPSSAAPTTATADGKTNSPVPGTAPTDTLTAPLTHLAAPSHFVDPSNNTMDLDAIGKGAPKQIGFDHFYSVAFVDCGIACGSYWFVDRRDGAVIASPDESTPPSSMIMEIAARPESDVVKVTYGPSDGVDDGNCWSRTYQLTETTFKPVSPNLKVVCPH